MSKVGPTFCQGSLSLFYDPWSSAGVGGEILIPSPRQSSAPPPAPSIGPASSPVKTGPERSKAPMCTHSMSVFNHLEPSLWGPLLPSKS